MVVPSMKATSERTARRRKIDNIWRECEQKKSELRGVVAPGVWRSPKLYIGVIVGLAVVGGAVFKATDAAVQRNVEPPPLRAMRHVDVLAEALGRYRFHVGSYPSSEQGLPALVRDPLVPKWDGPYINQLRKDPWGVPYVYAPPPDGAVHPLLLSCGPDKTRGTSDDIRPDAARFDPGTAWTNGWVSARERLPGVTVLPSQKPAGASE
jgi:general secretion pathway protein G